MRRTFADCLLVGMEKDKDIVLLVGDLGYKMFDEIFKRFPERAINCNASEQAMLDIAVGLSLCNKKVFVYSITPFLLWRPAETLRLYLNHEKIPVFLVGAGFRDDYSKDDGFSHDACDAKEFMSLFKNIQCYWPNNKAEIPEIFKNIIKNNKPVFLSLRR